MRDAELAILLYAVTAASSGLNAAYFLRYRTVALRRRVGAAVMAVVCLAALAQSLYLGWRLGPEDASASSGAWPGMAVAGLTSLSSLLVSALVLRQMLSRRARR